MRILNLQLRALLSRLKIPSYPADRAQMEIIRLSWGYLLKYVQTLYTDPAEAESAIGLLIARLPEIVQSYNPRYPPLAFLKGILRNGFVDMYRRVQRRKAAGDYLSSVYPSHTGPTELSADFLISEIQDSDVAKMRFLLGMEKEEIAKRTKMPVYKVQRRLTSARKSLFRTLEAS